MQIDTVRHHHIDYVVVLSKGERAITMTTMMMIVARWEVQVAVNANDDEVEEAAAADDDDDAKNVVEEGACCCDDRGEM